MNVKLRIMGALELRNLISEYVSTADERLLKIVKAVMESYHEDELTLTEEHKKILDQRLADHKANPKSGRSWKEVKSDLQAKHGI